MHGLFLWISAYLVLGILLCGLGCKAQFATWDLMFQLHRLITILLGIPARPMAWASKANICNREIDSWKPPGPVLQSTTGLMGTSKRIACCHVDSKRIVTVVWMPCLGFLGVIHNKCEVLLRFRKKNKKRKEKDGKNETAKSFMINFLDLLRPWRPQTLDPSKPGSWLLACNMGEQWPRAEPSGRRGQINWCSDFKKNRLISSDCYESRGE